MTEGGFPQFWRVARFLFVTNIHADRMLRSVDLQGDFSNF